MRTLYPPIKPISHRMLDVGDGHSLYVEECGNPDGIPAVFLHGGPGVGCGPDNRRFFDPERYRVLLFDQRGAGRSRPHAELEHNHTAKIIDDLELIRETFGIQRWLVFGGSWGSTLALLYAQAYPDRVLAMVLRGIYLNRTRDFDWLYGYGASRVYPDYWEELIAPIPEAERDDIPGAYYRRVVGDNPETAREAALAWSLWEGRCATLRIDEALLNQFRDPGLAWAFARISTHYFVNRLFMDPDQILDNAGRLAGIPGVIVHGRYDMICVLDQAHALHRSWPDSRLEIIPDAGHSATEPGIIDALVRAADEYAARPAT